MAGMASISGFFIGASGVGGGALVVPALLSLGTLSATEAIATSSVISMVLMASSSLLYAISGAVQWLIALHAGGRLRVATAGDLGTKATQSKNTGRHCGGTDCGVAQWHVDSVVCLKSLLRPNHRAKSRIRQNL